MKKNKKGLTLIELLAVIAIIAILFVLLIPQVNSAFDKAREAGVMTDFRSYEIAVKSYDMEKEAKDFEINDLNKYLDEELKFKNRSSKKINPYGYSYIIIPLNENTLKIVSKKKGKEVLELYANFESKDNKIYYYGFKNTNAINTVKNYNGIDYMMKNENEIMIVGYSGSEKDVVIPNKIEGYLVTEIGTDAFSNYDDYKGNRGTKISSVIIPESIIRIGNGAFEANELTSITLPTNLEKLGAHAFQNNKITSIILPSKIKEIGNYTFFENNLTSVTIPSNVTSVGIHAFSFNQISDLTIENGVKIIYASAFQINKYTTITLPASIEEIHNYAFYSESIQNYSIIGNPKISSDAFPATASRR